MKRQWRMVLISAGVLAACLLVWLIATLVKPAETPTATTTLPDIAPVFKADAADVKKAVFSSANGSVTVFPVGATDKNGQTTYTWNLQSEKEYPFDQDTINGMGNLALNVYNYAEIATDVTDMAMYGLDDPAATMTVFMKSGESHIVRFGNLLPTGFYGYAMLDNDGRLCKVSNSTADMAKRTLIDFLDKDKVVAIKANDLVHIDFSRARDNTRLAIDCQLVGDASSSETSYLKFTITDPIKRAGSSEKLTTFVNEICAVMAEQYVEIEPTDLAQYGLVDPSYSFRLQTADKTVNLHIGKKADDEHYYAISDQVPAVFLATASTFSTIDLKAVEMMDRLFALHNIWDVDHIDCDIFGQTFSVDITMGKNGHAEDEDVIFKLDGQDAKIFSEEDDSLFNNFFQVLIGPLIDGLDPEAQPVNTRDAIMKFHVKANSETSTPAYTKVIEFSKRDDYTYYVFIDDVYGGFYVDGVKTFTRTEAEHEGIIVAYKMLKYAMAHAVDGVFDTTKGYQLD